MVSGGNEGSKEKPKWTDSKVYQRKSFKGLKNVDDGSEHPQMHNMLLEDANLSKKLIGSHHDVASEGSSSFNRSLMSGSRGMLADGVGNLGFLGQDNSVRISLLFKSKRDMRQLKSKLRNELDLVRSLFKKIEAKDAQKSSSRTHDDSGKQLMHSDEPKAPQLPKTERMKQLSASDLENTHGMNDNVEKEKRKLKANKFYRNSEFLLAKDKLPSGESNKKSKSNAKKVGGIESGHGSGSRKFSNQVTKNCRALLERLMKHKHGWVFNQPVDTKGLGLHDYFDIIKNPMDLGTVKSRLETNWYNCPKAFAEDVRLTFQNAMTYNPEGQDVHMMAKDLLKMFEDKWVSIEADYMRESRLTADPDESLPTSTSSKVPQPGTRRPLDKANLKTISTGRNPKSVKAPQSGRTPAPKKPKAKDPNKRLMTYVEKQKLSTDLQNLPSEKLENVLQIIKKRNSSFHQQDEEIEVDIDSVDNETLWELDRFVTNYKKSLSKNKRKSENTEITFQAREEPEQNQLEKTATAAVVEDPKESKANELLQDASTSLGPTQIESRGKKDGRSSSSSSSGTDSGSSSTDSDSESSSGGRPNTTHSPKG